MGNTLSCASAGDNHSLSKSKSNINFRERYRMRSKMNSKSSEKLKIDNKFREITDKGDKNLKGIERKIIDDRNEKVREILNEC